MVIFSNSKSNDFWNFELNNYDLNFSFTYHGKTLKDILKFKVAHIEHGIPFLAVQHRNKNINCYRWFENKWVLKEWTFEKTVEDFFTAKDKEGICHLIVSLVSTNTGNNREIIHIYHDTQSWHKNLLSLNFGGKILNLTYLISENSIKLTIVRKINTNKHIEIYKWLPKDCNWSKELILSNIKGVPLCTEYSPDHVHIVSLIKKDFLKLEYRQINIKNNKLVNSDFFMLPTYLPRDCYFVKDKELFAIVCSSLEKSYLYYSRDKLKWTELPIKGFLEKVYNTSGYISSNISIKNYYDVTFKSPTIMSLSNLIKLHSI